MNKIIKILLSILGGLEAVVSIALPILVVILWTKSIGQGHWSSNLLIIVGICASIFRAIKIGFYKKI